MRLTVTVCLTEKAYVDLMAVFKDSKTLFDAFSVIRPIEGFIII